MATSDNLNPAGRPATRSGTGFLGKAPIMPPQPPRPSESVRPAIEMPPSASLPSSAAMEPTPQRRSETELRTLIVGREIALSGEISSCDRLVVEGSVEANLANCRFIDIAESGLFKGSASIDEAEIRGRFEGSLTARKRLIVRATGKIVAKVSYVQIEIEAGGQISGEIQVLSPEDAASSLSSPAPGGRHERQAEKR
jgi:cytoskeletal protein CcmA (bactofilin family)